MSFRLGLLILMSFLISSPSSAQLLTVTGEFRVVEVDVPNMRLGVARLEADPNVRQNWVTMRANTKITVREESADGSFRDKQEKVEEAMSRLKPGDLVRVHGGRGFDGGISAKTLAYSRIAELAASESDSGPQALLPEGRPLESKQVSEQGGENSSSDSITYPEVSWSGNVLESTPEAVLLEVAPDQVVRVPNTALFHSEGSPVTLSELEPGDALKATLPRGTGTLVSASQQVVTMQTPDGLIQVPTSSLSQQVRDSVQVPVITQGGSALSLPLSSALSMQASDGATILNRSLLSSGAVPSVPGTGVMLQAFDDGIVVLTPNGQLLRLAGVKQNFVPGSGVSFDPSGGTLKVTPLRGASLFKGTPGKSGGKGKGKGRGKPGF